MTVEVVSSKRNISSAEAEIVLRSAHYRALKTAPAFQDAADGAQDGIVLALTHLDRIYPGKLPEFTGSCARNATIDLLRKKKRGGATSLDQLKESGFDPSDPRVSTDPQQAAEQSEDTRRVREAIESLPFIYREVINARYFQGLSQEETSQAIGIAKGTIKSRQSRGESLLRERLKDFR